MNRHQGPEYVEVQRPAWQLLRDHFGYAHADGQSEAFARERENEGETLLLGRLTRKLKEINERLSDDGARQAIAALRQPLATTLIDANETCHRLMSRWVTIEEAQGGKVVGRSVRYIDFERPENHEFLVVEELTVKGPCFTRRLDLVVFINGIPVVAIECKGPGEQHGITKAVHDLLLYQDAGSGVVRLFHTVQLCMALKRSDARC